jgi:hypothetical protein
MSLAPVPAEQPSANCANCGAPLVADQRYCLSCGRPVSPVRLAFLDALTPGQAASAAPGWPVVPGTIQAGPAGYIPLQVDQSTAGWLRRNSGLLSLLVVLALFLLAGLLVGHWVSQSKAPSSQTIKIEGLSGLGAIGATTTGASTTPTPTTSTSTGSSKANASSEKKEAEEGAHETKAEKAPPKAATRLSKSRIEKLNNSSGKKKEEELNALGNKPIETGG